MLRTYHTLSALLLATAATAAQSCELYQPAVDAVNAGDTPTETEI